MPASIETPHMLTGSRVIVTPEGITIVKRVFVKDIPVLSDGDDAVLIRALDTAGIPKVGDQHPVVPQCTVRQIEAEAPSVDQAYIDIVYRSPDNETGDTGGGGGQSERFTVTYGTAVAQQETQNDVFGAPMLTNFALDGLNGDHGKIIKNTVTLPVLIPQRTIEARGTVVGAPNSKYFDFTGYVNDRAWRGGLPRTWLYMGMQATTADGGQTYSCVATWLHNPFTWDGYGIHRQPDGSIHKRSVEAAQAMELRDPIKQPGVHATGGVGRYHMYHNTNFDAIFNFV